MPSTCSALLASGKNRGTVCGRTVEKGLSFCRYHRNHSQHEKGPDKKVQQVENDLSAEQCQEPLANANESFDEEKFIRDLQQIYVLMQPLSRWIEMTRTTPTGMT